MGFRQHFSHGSELIESSLPSSTGLVPCVRHETYFLLRCIGVDGVSVIVKSEFHVQPQRVE
jgi:hypothetical protein